jgi:5-methylcytosine-specific restriction endonuclease McrA
MSLIAPRAASVCSAIGCPQPALRGSRYCAEHRPYRRGWPALRKTAIARDGGACVRCGSRGPFFVHHLRPLAFGGPLLPRLDELETLCRSCHT